MNPCCSTNTNQYGVGRVPPRHHSTKNAPPGTFFILLEPSFYLKNQKTTLSGHKIRNLVGICGLEPQTSSLSVTRSNQLSYIPNSLYSTLSSSKNQAKAENRNKSALAPGSLFLTVPAHSLLQIRSH